MVAVSGAADGLKGVDMPDYSIPLQVQGVSIKSPLEAMREAAATKNAMMAVQDQQESRARKQRLNELYQQAGGDFEKMLQSGGLDMDTAVQLQGIKGEQAKLQAQAAKEQAAADKNRLQAGIEKLNYGSQLLAGATPENWQQIRQEFGQMTGADLGEQFDANKVGALMQQGLQMKDRLANEWKQKGYELDVAQFGEQQRHNRTAEGISYMNAQNRGDGGATVNAKAPTGYQWNTDGTALEPIPGGPADMKVQAQQQKLQAKQQKDISAMENADASSAQALTLIDQIASHKGKSDAVGLSSVANVVAIPGSDRQDFLSKLDQLKGQQFLQAFQSLKGAGAITEVEGKKAEQAIANLNAAQSEDQFDQALQEYRKVISDAQSRTQKNMAQYNRAMEGDVSQSVEPQATAPRSVVRTGTINGRKVVQYSDGTTEYAQ